MLTSVEIPQYSGRINAWSYSTLKKCVDCAHQLYLAKIKRKKGKKGPQLLRGSEIHDGCEAYIKGLMLNWIEEIDEGWRDHFDDLRLGYTDNKAFPELELAFTKDWKQIDWMDPQVWCRFKVDAVIVEDDEITFIDFKTGRKDGNEFAHKQQLKYYAVAIGMLYPDVSTITGQIWYLDQPPGTIMIQDYDRDFIISTLPLVNERGLALTERIFWQPRPGSACKWCDVKEHCIHRA